MSHDAKHTLFSAEQDTGAAARNSVAPLLKTWVTPKVITSTTLEEDTANSNLANSDGASGSNTS